MVERVIVTLVCDGCEFDMEIPADIRMELVKPMIARAITGKGVSVSKTFALVCNGYSLSDMDTLFEAGVWDGSYLKVI